ncbi:hypothetical protein ABN224_16245 [Providencia rettgeri]
MMKTRIITVLFSLFVFSAQSADIQTKETILGQVYTDNKGMTLYVFDKDKTNQSNCYDDCAKAWPPFLVNGEGLQISRLGKAPRKDGNPQWTLNHKPLYLWNKDRKPGDITGAGINNIWSLARADQIPVQVYTSEAGKILTNNNKMTLYTFSNDSQGISECYNDCAKNWPPLIAKKEDVSSGNFSIIPRKDGTYQWAYNGKPLYTWAKDTKPGDMTGNKVMNIWHIVHL